MASTALMCCTSSAASALQIQPVQHSLSKLTTLAAPRRSSVSVTTCSLAEDVKSEIVCSRREVLGFGGLLAAGFGNLVMGAPEADAAQATCGEYNVAPSGLAYCDSTVGSGITATKGMLIKAHYSGRLENGNQFDSSYSRGKPLTFRVGVGEVIRGWDQGILGTEGIPAMQAGGKRTLRIPANLGYGERGAGCRLGSCLIPPNSTLVFDVEFVGKA